MVECRLCVVLIRYRLAESSGLLPSPAIIAITYNYLLINCYTLHCKITVHSGKLSADVETALPSEALVPATAF
jgi:hypothetical protein